MLNEGQVLWLRQQHGRNLAGWREPDGVLVPTEPDPDARQRTRDELRAAIETLDRVLVSARAADGGRLKADG